MTRGKEGSGMTEERNRRMTGTERDEIMRLAVVDTILLGTKEKLKARAGMVVRGRARLGLAAWAVDSLLEDLMGTIPANQLLALRNNLRMNAFTIGAKRPGGGRADNEYGIWISFNELNALLAGCTRWGCRPRRPYACRTTPSGGSGWAAGWCWGATSRRR